MRLPRRRARQVYRVWDEAEFLASHAVAGSNANLELERPGHARLLMSALLLLLVTAIVVVTIVTRSQSTLRGPRRQQAQARRTRSQPLRSAMHLAQTSHPAPARKIGKGRPSLSASAKRRRTRSLARRAWTRPPTELQAASYRPRAVASVSVPSEPHEFGFER